MEAIEGRASTKAAENRLQDGAAKATGTKKLPTLKLADGTVISHSKAILSWIDQQK